MCFSSWNNYHTLYENQGRVRGKTNVHSGDPKGDWQFSNDLRHPEGREIICN